MSDLVRGQLSDTAWRLAQELPVFGRFISVGRDLDEIWRSGPLKDAALRDEVIERAADLVQTFRGEVTERFADLGDYLEARLAMLEQLARRGVTDAAVGEAFYLAMLNEGVVGDQDLAVADFAVRYLAEADLRVLLHEYDRLPGWQELQPSDFARSSSLPQVTAFEAGYLLSRLRDFGFLFSDPAMTAEPGEDRIFTPDLRAIDHFSEAVGLVRMVTVSPSREYAGVAAAYEAGNLPAFVTQVKRVWRGAGLAGGVVRRHLLDGYQWRVVESDSSGRSRFTGSYETSGDAQLEATDELRRLGLSVNWVPVGA